MLQIAESLSISAGNLSYHYKNKAVLLSKIYDDIHNESLNFLNTENTYITLHHYELIMLKFNHIQNKYTFFFNELVHIARVYPEIIRKYELANIKRFKDARKIINYYIKTGRILEEKNTINYDKLIYNIFMISTFWQSQSQIINHKKFLTNKSPITEMLWSLLIPYLTELGIQEYNQIKLYVKN